jgi:hypothetical protein
MAIISLLGLNQLRNENHSTSIFISVSGKIIGEADEVCFG